MARFVSLPDAAAEYGVNPRTLRRWIAAGEIVGYRFGVKLLRVDADELETKLRPIPTARTG